MQEYPNISIVVIGFNEAENLERTFTALKNMNYPAEKLEFIYADSGSADNSVEIAKRYTDKVFIEPLYPSPGRNRNRGLVEAKYDMVHFLDGDVEIDGNYLKNIAFLFAEKDVHAISGNLAEIKPSFYNKLASMANMDMSEGYSTLTSTGGSYIKSALLSVEGYDERIVRGEETELGVRFRGKGYKLWCTSHKLGNHNFGINSLSDYFKRDIADGKWIARGALLKGDNQYFKQSRTVFRNQLIKLSFLVALLLVCLIKGNILLFFAVWLSLFVLQSRSILVKFKTREKKIVFFKFILNFIGQFFLFYGLLKEFGSYYFSRKLKAYYALEKQVISR